jgi:hypothetical protein
MVHHIGLKQASICVVNQGGSVVREGIVDSEPEANRRVREIEGTGSGTDRP